MVEVECECNVAVDSLAAKEISAPMGNEVERILRAQPLNPFRKVSVTAMPRFPVIPPPPKAADTETPSIETNKFRYTIARMLTGGVFADVLSGGRTDCVKEIEGVYAKLDEVIV